MISFVDIGYCCFTRVFFCLTIVVMIAATSNNNKSNGSKQRLLIVLLSDNIILICVLLRTSFLFLIALKALRDWSNNDKLTVKISFQS